MNIKEIKITKYLLEVAVPRQGDTVITTMSMKEAMDFFGGRNGDWQVYGILKHAEPYGAELREVRTRGKELTVIFEFSSKEELEKFYADHQQD